MKYYALMSDSVNDLNSRINGMLEDGWELAGGISISVSAAGTYLSQALCKSPKNPTAAKPKKVIRRKSK